MDKIKELLSCQQKLSGIRKECDESSSEFMVLTMAMEKVSQARDAK